MRTYQVVLILAGATLMLLGTLADTGRAWGTSGRVLLIR